MRLLGIDFGTKKVGISISDAEGSVAFPREVLSNNGDLLPKLKEIIDSEGIATVVVGESLDRVGEDNPVMAKARAFAKKLKNEAHVTVVFEAERYTTKEAERIQGPTPLTDASAAALILQGYLDKQRHA